MLTDAEIETEKRYIIAERLGILCGKERPTADALKIAHDEANAWEKQQRGELDFGE